MPIYIPVRVTKEEAAWASKATLIVIAVILGICTLIGLVTMIKAISKDVKSSGADDEVIVYFDDLSIAKRKKNMQISSVADDLNSDDYTTASWQELQDAIKSATFRVGIATSVDAVEAVVLPDADSILQRRN